MRPKVAQPCVAAPTPAPLQDKTMDIVDIDSLLLVLDSPAGTLSLERFADVADLRILGESSRP